MATTRVLDTIIKSINGEEITAWSQNQAGEWQVSRVGGEPAAEAAPGHPAPAAE